MGYPVVVLDFQLNSCCHAVIQDQVMLVTIMEEPQGVYASSSRNGAGRLEEEEADRTLTQLELFMSRRSEAVSNIHILPSSSASDAPPNACNLHLIPMKDTKKPKSQVFGKSTLDIVKGMKQHVYDDNGVQYLDCVNGTSQGFTSDLLSRYVSALLDTLPEPLSVCYLTNSGSEANDLALRLAAAFNGNEDIIVVEDGYHGNISSLIDASPKMHPRYNLKKKEHIHIVKLPDLFRGKYRYEDEEAGIKFAREVEEKIRLAEAKGRKIGAFLSEPMFVIPGIFIPPTSYYQHVFRVVQEHGGLVIADEVQSGLGRAGNNMWGFQDFGPTPDIVTVGKGLGNGFPMGAVMCSKEVSERLGGYFSTFGGNPVACAIGLSVLEVIKNEKLISSANRVGRTLQQSLQDLKERFPCVGDVRGRGLVQAVEVVNNKMERHPAPDPASEIMFALKSRQG